MSTVVFKTRDDSSDGSHGRLFQGRGRTSEHGIMVLSAREVTVDAGHINLCMLCPLASNSLNMSPCNPSIAGV